MHEQYVIRAGAILFPLLCNISASFSNAAEVDFARDIQPIFAEHCTNCHGPDKQKGGLNLTKQDSVLSKLKSGNHAVIAGKPNQSELMRRLTTRDEDDLMPPPDKGKKLSVSILPPFGNGLLKVQNGACIGHIVHWKTSHCQMCPTLIGSRTKSINLFSPSWRPANSSLHLGPIVTFLSSA